MKFTAKRRFYVVYIFVEALVALASYRPYIHAHSDAVTGSRAKASNMPSNQEQQGAFTNIDKVSKSQGAWKSGTKRICMYL